MLALIFKGETERLEREHKLTAWTVWHIAALTRCNPKHFPTLQEMTGEKPKPKVQTPEEMKAVFAAMRAARAEV